MFECPKKNVRKKECSKKECSKKECSKKMFEKECSNVRKNVANQNIHNSVFVIECRCTILKDLFGNIYPVDLIHYD
jgi:hypothetical protein